MKYSVCVIAALAAIFTFQRGSAADQIRIEIENAAPSGGFFFTPVFLGFHDGNYDFFDGGAFASPELEALAEGGATAPLSSQLLSQQATAQAATVLGDSFGPPPFDPGESIAATFDVDSSTQRFLSYASMVIPSNDAFFGNDNPLEIFDVNGDFVGQISFEITAAMIYDAGTEVNDINGGAAFSANGGTSTSESNPIGLIDLNDLNDFIGTQTVSGATISSGFSPNTVVARFTITQIPEPGSAVVLGLLGVVGVFRRHRR